MAEEAWKVNEVVMAVGDVNSDEKGTGARANGGKPAMDLIPLRLTLWSMRDCYEKAVLHLVADFQEGDDDAIIRAVSGLRPDDLEEAARVLEYGAKKYAAWNWLKGMPWSVPFGCIGRHYLAMARGEKVDPESERSHWGHIVCNILMLAMYVEVYRDGDDRPPKELFEDGTA